MADQQLCVLGPVQWTPVAVAGSPVAVVVVVVITPQCSQAAQADSVGEKDLRPSVHPHLEEGTKMWALRESDVG